jgi:hypothetical protein
MMNAIAITGPLLMKVLYAIEPYSPHHGEVSEAIAQAANSDPLFPSRQDGCLRTAAILIAIAWYGSRFQPTLVGDNGKSFGLYQIQPPSANALGKLVTTNMLTNVRDASLVAIDLIRQSMVEDGNKSWEERLSWFCSTPECRDRSTLLKKSFTRMLFADKIVRDHFPEFVALGKPAFVEQKHLKRLSS